MSTILIVDAYKSSLVMTSEIFKDKILGATIFIAKNGKECLDLVNEHIFDMIVVDFDLPDADGITLTKLLRKVYPGPILLTAFPDKNVKHAIETELSHYYDVSGWLKKPLKCDDLCEKIDQFLHEKKRVRKRYSTEIEALLTGKGAGRGKRAPKVKGNVLNLSIGGALIKLDGLVKVKPGDETALTLYLNSQNEKSKNTKKTNNNEEAIKKTVSKIKAKIAWTHKGKKQAGLYFENLTESHRKTLIDLLNNSEEV